MNKNIKKDFVFYSTKLMNGSRILSILFFIVAIAQLLLTFSIPIGANSDPVEVYLRNISSVVALLAMSEFFSKYYNTHTGIEGHTINMISFKKTSLILVIVSAVKILISSFFAFKYLVNLNIVGLYYLTEIFVWAAVAIFAFLYFKRSIIGSE